MIYGNLVYNKISCTNNPTYKKSANKKYNGLPENLVKEIKKRAREGAQKNEYMYGDEFNNFYKSAKLTYASPDFSKVKSMAVSRMNYHLRRGHHKLSIFEELWGYGVTFTPNYGENPLIDIYEGKERVLSYDAKIGGWRRCGMTKDERDFSNDFKELYLSEYRKAKAEMKNPQVKDSSVKISLSTNRTKNFSMSV